MLALLVLARAEPVILNYHLHLNYAAWRELVRSYFLMGNWNMLWYALVVITIVGARRLLEPHWHRSRRSRRQGSLS